MRRAFSTRVRSLLLLHQDTTLQISHLPIDRLEFDKGHQEKINKGTWANTTRTHRTTSPNHFYKASRAFNHGPKWASPSSNAAHAAVLCICPFHHSTLVAISELMPSWPRLQSHECLLSEDSTYLVQRPKEGRRSFTHPASHPAPSQGAKLTRLESNVKLTSPHPWSPDQAPSPPLH